MDNLNRTSNNLSHQESSDVNSTSLLSANNDADDDFNNSRGTKYLHISTVKKMLQRFLTEQGMSKEELAAALKITVWNLEQLFSSNAPPPRLLSKVNMPLIKLYCSTKWQ